MLDRKSKNATLLTFRLRGSQEDMGRQHGEILRDTEGWRQLLDFYPQMAVRMLTMRMPLGIRRMAHPVFRRFLDTRAERLHQSREQLFPRYFDRTAALLLAAGVDPSLAVAFTVMDVTQNAIARLASVLPSELTGLKIAGNPGCSSVAVWGDRSEDGLLRHARNFDFPGVGVWDPIPALVYCDPVEGLRYAFVTALGADAPGVTCFNEAGLTLTTHTRFHREVNSRQAVVMDIGHEIIRRARTLEEAVHVAKSIPSSSTWGYLISSASEGRAIVLETHSEAWRVTEPTDEYMITTNHYLHPYMQVGEVITTEGFRVDSQARYYSIAQQIKHATSNDESLKRLLMSVYNPDAVGHENEGYALCGDCVSAPHTVKSIVAVPEAEQLHISVGHAPSSLGPWVVAPWNQWDGPVGRCDDLQSTGKRATPGSDPHAPDAGGALDHYIYAVRRQIEGAHTQELRELLKQACALAPKEPHFHFAAGTFAIMAGDLSSATDHLESSRTYAASPYRRALALLWLQRVHHLRGNEEASTSAAGVLQRMKGDHVKHLCKASLKELRNPRTLRSLRGQLPDLLLIDA